MVMAALFATTCSLAPGNPVPHGIPLAVVSDETAHAATVQAVSQVAGAPDFRVVDTRPLGVNDPNGVDIFSLMPGTTILGFVAPFQVWANAAPLSLRGWCGFVLAHASAGALVLALVAGSVLQRLALPVAEGWVILTLLLVAAASFASLMAVLMGNRAILPTWLFFVALGHSSSGGAVAPPLLPPGLACASQWLPSGATVTALRNAEYVPGHQHLHPVAVLAGRLGPRQAGATTSTMPIMPMSSWSRMWQW